MADTGAGETEKTGPNAPPIATATVAKLYLGQGKLDRAEQIYRSLLARAPKDPRLLRGLTEVQRRRERLQSAADDGDRVALELRDGKLRCTFQVTGPGRARAPDLREIPSGARPPPAAC